MIFDGVSIIGYFNASTGLAESARRQYQSFRAVRYPAAAYDVPLKFREHQTFHPLETGVSKYSQAIIHVNPPELLNAGHGLGHIKRGSHYVIGFWHWELPVFPPAWTAAIDLIDEIWVPSAFVADVYRAFVKKPVRIVPHAVPLNHTSKEEARRDLGLPPDRFLLLSIFDSSSYASRKNPEAAVRAFIDAFDRETTSAPLLVVKMHGGKRNSELGDLLSIMEAHPLIKVIDRTLDESGIRNLQAACDCFISLHRSEGFGFNLAECMAAGRPVIATNFSGNSDFMNTENSIPIPYSVRLIKPGEYVQGNGQWWAEPSHDAAVEAIRWVAAHSTETAVMGDKARQYMSVHHSFERIGQTAVAALQAKRPALSQAQRTSLSMQISPPMNPRGLQGEQPPKIGRNQLCPCGSGRKFKKCHGSSALMSQ